MYEISIYDKNFKLISQDYKRFDDRQQAELRAEKYCDWLGGKYWEVIKVR